MPENLRKLLTGKREKPRKITSKDLLSTGCTVLNLACSGKASGGVAKGTYVYLVGDSSTGKTWMAFTLFAEAAINPNFDGYRFVYDNAENGALMDVKRYFGSQVESRLEVLDPPSSTVEEMYYRLDDLVRAKEPFIFVEDSVDALDTEDDEGHFAKSKEAFIEGKEVKGTYGVAKAKANSSRLRGIVNKLPRSGSILVLLSQTRDRIGGYGGKTRSGGRALTFYAHHEIWTAIRERLKNKDDRVVGSQVVAKVAKNRLTGWEGEVLYTFLKRHGVDDVGSSIDFLVDEKIWKAVKGIITAPEFDYTGRKERLVRKVEAEGLETDLRDLVAEKWLEIEEASTLKRKNRYV